MGFTTPEIAVDRNVPRSPGQYMRCENGHWAVCIVKERKGQLGYWLNTAVWVNMADDTVSIFKNWIDC